MIYYVVTNKTHHNLSLEDCKTTIPPYGSVYIPQDLFINSVSIQELATMVNWKRVVNPSGWFKSSDNVIKSDRKPAPAPPPSVQSVDSIPTPKHDEKIDALLDKMDRLISLISSGQIPVTTRASGSDQPSLVNVEPLFIPKELVPQNADARLNMKSDESDRPDINEAASVLKAMRRKKK